MSKNPQRPVKPPESTRPAGSSSSPTEPRAWRPVWRALVSVLLLAHLAVVFAVPLAMIPPQSMLAEWFVGYVRPYVDVFQVSHGYAFFGPDPGPSHLVEYELTMPDGKVERGRIPDLKKEWPRLLYHRHFMLSEKLEGFRVPQDPPPRPQGTQEEMTEWQQAMDQWRRDRDLYLAVAGSYADHLRQATGADRVRLFAVERQLPAPDTILVAGKKLSDPEFYVVSTTPIADVTKDHPGTQAGTPAGGGQPEEIRMPEEKP